MNLVVIPFRINITNNYFFITYNTTAVVIPLRINISNNRLFVYT